MGKKGSAFTAGRPKGTKNAPGHKGGGARKNAGRKKKVVEGSGQLKKLFARIPEGVDAEADVGSGEETESGENKENEPNMEQAAEEIESEKESQGQSSDEQIEVGQHAAIAADAEEGDISIAPKPKIATVVVEDDEEEEEAPELVDDEEVAVGQENFVGDQESIVRDYIRREVRKLSNEAYSRGGRIAQVERGNPWIISADPGSTDMFLPYALYVGFLF